MKAQKIHPASSETSTALARKFHDIMAPVPSNEVRENTNKNLPVNRGPSYELQSLRSPFRTKIYEGISKKAYKLVPKLQAISRCLSVSGPHNLNQITLTLDQEKGIISAEEMLSAPEIKEISLGPVADLLALINERGSDKTDNIFLFLGFDEAANIDTDVLMWVHRIMRFYIALPIWSIFLSTSNSFPTLMPPRSGMPSSRIQDRTLVRVAPFFRLQLDVEAQRRINVGDEAEIRAELCRSLNAIASVDHLTSYGRPLWRIYCSLSYERLAGFVKWKILGTSEANGIQQTLALLASRICLDQCSNADAKFFAASVDSHLRIVVRMDDANGRISTITPAEPVVSDVAASLLMAEVHPTSEICWTSCITTFCQHILRDRKSVV